MRQRETTNGPTVRYGVRALVLMILATAFWLAPGAAVSPSFAQSYTQTPKNIILFYDDYPTSGDPEFQVTQTIARPLVAHLDQNGRPTDWMFDSFIFYSLSLFVTKQPAQAQAYIDSWIDYLFNGNQIANLDATVAEVKVVLGQPDYRMNVFLTVPVAFNATDSSVGLDNVKSGMLSNVDTLLARWNALNPPNLRLVGFYWGYSEDLLGYNKYRAVDQLVKDAATYVHSKDLTLLMIPYVGAAGYDRLHTLGVDYVTMQPNYAWDQNNDLYDFGFVSEQILAGYVDGVEFELPIDWVACCGGDWRTNFNTHFEQAAKYNWSNRIATYYYGSAISVMARSPNSDHQAAYDKLYGYIRPTPTPPPTQTVTFYTDPSTGAVKADDVIETDGATENYASGTRVHVVANPPTGYSFANWEISGVSVDNPLSQDTYMMVSASGWLKVHFVASSTSATQLPIIGGRIVSASDSPDPLARGRSVNFTIGIKNVGNVVWSSAIITIKIYSPDGALYATPTLSVGNIGPGVAYTYNMSWNAPSDALRGIWRYEVYLNYGNIPIGSSTSPGNTITIE